MTRIANIWLGIAVFGLSVVSTVPWVLADATELATVGDEVFPAVVEIEGARVPLRGAGLLEYWRLDVYTAAFYVPAAARTTAAVLGGVPRRLTLRYHRNIRADQIVGASRKALARNPAVNEPVLRKRLATMFAAFVSVGDGDEYQLEYGPAADVTILRFNGQETCRVAGADFAAAFFGIWVSDHPLSKKLRDILRAEEE